MTIDQNWVVVFQFVWALALTYYVQHLHARIEREHIHFTRELIDLYDRMKAGDDLTARSERLDVAIEELRNHVR